MTGENVPDYNTPSDGMHRSSLDKTASTSPSYVYPVRSLFTGIHPVNHDNTSISSQSTRNLFSRSASTENILDFRDVQHWSQEVTDATASQDRTGTSRDHGGITETPCHTDETKTSHRTRSHELEVFEAVDEPALMSGFHSPHQRHHSKVASLFNSTSEFIASCPRLPTSLTSGRFLVEEAKTLSSLASERAHEGATISNARRPPLLPEVAVEALATVVPSVVSQTMPALTQAVSPSLLEPSHPISEQTAAPSLPYNPSEYGLVHLPPLPASPSPHSSDRGGGSSRSSDKRSTAHSRHSHSRHSRSHKTGVSKDSSPPRSKSGTSDLQSDEAQDGDDDRLSSNTLGSVYWSASEGHTAASSPFPISSPSLHIDSGGSQSGLMTSSQWNLSSQATSRLVHVQDENGNHMILGREGTLLRCEDEVSMPYCLNPVI